MSLTYDDVEPFFGIRIETAEAVTFGVLKIKWSDDVTGIVDLRPMIARGDAFAVLKRDGERFNAVQVSEGGHAVYWLDDDGTELDFGADQTRAWSEKQAALIALAS